jgi:hypothetical protein
MDVPEDITSLLAQYDAGRGELGVELVADVMEQPMERLQTLLPDGEWFALGQRLLSLADSRQNILGLPNRPVQSLADIPRIQAMLELEIMDLRDEIALLKSELERDQDPERMQLIQNLIGVRAALE